MDESFIDFTGPVQAALLERYPQLAAPPPESPLGLDTPLPPPPESIEWNAIYNVVPVYPESTSDSENANDNAAGEGENGVVPETRQDPPITWHDVALSIATDLMFQARAEIRKALGYTTSAVRK